jgi:hypothetical protein
VFVGAPFGIFGRVLSPETEREHVLAQEAELGQETWAALEVEECEEAEVAHIQKQGQEQPALGPILVGQTTWALRQSLEDLPFVHGVGQKPSD